MASKRVIRPLERAILDSLALTRAQVINGHSMIRVGRYIDSAVGSREQNLKSAFSFKEISYI